MNAAADDSLRLVGEARRSGRGSVAPRRCVIVAVADDAQLRPVDDPDALASAIELAVPLGWKHVESIHVDDLEAEPDVAAAAEGDESAFERTTEEDLMWYDVAERDELARDLAFL